jgi:hypothetical protein
MRQSLAVKNVRKEAEDIIGIRHQATTGEDTAGWEDLVCPIGFVKCSIKLYKCAINPITNPNHVYSHSKSVTILKWILKEQGVTSGLNSSGSG